MAAKLIIGVIAIVVVFGLVLLFTFRYLKQREEHRHEKEMLREERDAEMLTGDSIERELERERE